MLKIIIPFAVFYLLTIPLVRCFLLNLNRVGYYAVKDIYTYILDRKWEDFNLFGIDMFIGMFGRGKTLTMTHKVVSLYKRYGDKLRIISNYKLKDIPYTPLINFNQLVDLNCIDSSPPAPQGLDEEYTDYLWRVLKYDLNRYMGEESKIIGTVVCIDEVSSILSNRNYANFPLELLGLLCQPRKKNVYIMCSAQRFFMVDKLFRSLTTNVYDCRKIWRFQRYSVFDAWDYENATNSSLIQPLASGCWFVRDIDYSSYDTSELIDKNKAADFISNEESLTRKGLDSAKVVNLSGSRMSKKGRKIFSGTRK